MISALLMCLLATEKDVVARGILFEFSEKFFDNLVTTATTVILFRPNTLTVEKHPDEYIFCQTC